MSDEKPFAEVEPNDGTYDDLVVAGKVIVTSKVAHAQAKHINAAVAAERRDAAAKALRAAINVARGCLDYCGGYRNDAELEAFRHGIRTVVRSLEAKAETPDDSQVRALENIGRAAGEAEAAR